MKHLTVEEMIDFVSFDKLDEKSLTLAAKVNAHISECACCRKNVKAFQVVYDEFERSGRSMPYRAAKAEDVSFCKKQNDKTNKRMQGMM